MFSTVLHQSIFGSSLIRLSSIIFDFDYELILEQSELMIRFFSVLIGNSKIWVWTLMQKLCYKQC